MESEFVVYDFNYLPYIVTPNKKYVFYLMVIWWDKTKDLYLQ